MEGKNCLITGATSGIGEAAAMELAKKGVNIFFIARDKSKADALKRKILNDTGKDSFLYYCRP